MSKSITIFGLHAVRAALTAHPDTVLEVFVGAGRDDGAIREVIECAGRAGLAVQRAREDRLAALAASQDHQGVVARRRPLPMPELGVLLAERMRDALIVVLDQVQDPHNLGAVLRVADAAGVDAVIVPTRRAAHLTGAACKVAAGAAESVPLIEVPNLAQALTMLKDAGVWLTGLADDANEKVFDLDFGVPSAFVLGNEHEGIRALTRKHCDHLARIPMAGSVESLNVSTATAVCLFEAVRQRAAVAAEQGAAAPKC